jgi:hypothetical protein
LDPDEFADGIKPFLGSSEKKMEDVCEFLARYVRKLHADRYLKNVINSDPGVSFLDIIGPSDIAYVITLVKNSKLVWLQAPNSGNDEDQGNTKKIKPLFTAGEGKKRVFGETTWSKTGTKYYDKAKENWRDCFNPKHPYYKILKSSWEKWMSTKAKKMVLGSWTRKSIHSVLATREDTKESGHEGERKGGKRMSNDSRDTDDNSEDEDDEDEVEYGSDLEDHPLITSCAALKRSSVGSSEKRSSVGSGEMRSSVGSSETGGGGKALPGGRTHGGDEMTEMSDENENEKEDEDEDEDEDSATDRGNAIDKEKEVLAQNERGDGGSKHKIGEEEEAKNDMVPQRSSKRKKAKK